MDAFNQQLSSYGLQLTEYTSLINNQLISHASQLTEYINTHYPYLSTRYVAAAVAAILISFVFKSSGTKQLHWLERDLTLLGKPRKDEKKLSGTAVVCGGSVSGLLTARILSNHFASVVLVDPEYSKVQSGQPKTRLVQYDHLHAYMPLSVDVFQGLFPNFLKEASDAGASIAPADFRAHVSGRRLHSSRTGLRDTFFLPRERLDILLQKVFSRECPQVRIIDGLVRKFLPSDDRQTVNSVVARDNSGIDVVIEDISLVVDCTGGAQSGLKMLKSAGYALPDDIRKTYDSEISYTTTTFQVSEELDDRLPIPGDVNKFGCMYIFNPKPKDGGAGFAFSRSDLHSIQFTCTGWGYDVAHPTTPEDILAYVAAIKSEVPIDAWIAQTLTLLIDEGSPVLKYGKIQPRSHIHYHDIPTELPTNFIAVGDSHMALNPIYGQGVSKVALQAILLSTLLHNTPAPRPGLTFGRSFFAESESKTESLWHSVKDFDYGFATTKPAAGETLEVGGFSRWFSRQIMLSTSTDDEVADALWHVSMILAPPAALMTPRVLLGLLIAGLGRQLRLWP